MRYSLVKPYKSNPIVKLWVNACASCGVGDDFGDEDGDGFGREMTILWESGKRNKFVKKLEDKYQDELKVAYQDQLSGKIEMRCVDEEAKV